MTLPKPKPLGELEEAVLSALWSSASPLSVREVLGRVQRRPALAYTTVLTVLDRLHEKGMVDREKEGKAFLYRPRASKEAWLGEQAARMLTAERGPPSSAVLMAFLDSAERADPALIEHLSSLIELRRAGSSQAAPAPGKKGRST
ncbi:BlaI/MecI/CopY family transcriptional regulator [Sorangium sp. So ce295]|uniref:BlaI/MecI/CopY family transcriptional regulator n=1 Tax=Sorangium sp. So ce295 TaxID=3133295 RepID=UPI003F61785F